MILRKPYALLIKYFKKINIVLLGLVLFLFYKTMRFHQFAKNYLDSNVYNSKIDAISNYFNKYTIIAFLFVFIICGILIYLLRKKDKPYFSYILIVVVNAFAFFLLVYANNFFMFKALEGFKIVNAKTINDLSLIANILYYPLLLILLIRALGIDLKNFGFQEDKEFMEINEADREEVEVNVGFDKEKWLRNFKFYFRNTKYFIIEHKASLACVFGIVLLIALFQFYNYFYVENKIYGMNKTIYANNYGLKVKNVYLTDKDYHGNIITNDNKYFILVDLEVKNKLSRDRLFDIEKMLLFIDDQYYVPSTRYNNYFKDMGSLYIGKELKGKETTSYLLIYDVPKPDSKANFVLKYQDVGDVKLVQIKIKVLDISEFRDKGSAVYPEAFHVPINENESMTFSINNYTISDTVDYTYQACDSTGSCPVFQTTFTSNSGRKVLHLKFKLEDKERDEFLSFVNGYGKIKYVIDGVEKTIQTTNAITKKYRGNHVYLSVPSEIENASKIDLVFTVRSYQYTYHLKGE